MADYIIERRLRHGATWLFVEIPGAIVRDSNRPDSIERCYGGVKIRVGIDPTGEQLEEATLRMQEYLAHLPPVDQGDDRDTYLIQGFEVYERTAKPRGNTGMLQVPAGDIGKRFKIVRIDP